MPTEPAPGPKRDRGGNLIQKPISQRPIVPTDPTPGSKRGEEGKITQGPILYKPRRQGTSCYDYRMIYTGDDSRVSGNIVRAAKELPKVLKNFDKILIYLTNKQNKWWKAIEFKIILMAVLKVWNLTDLPSERRAINRK